MRDMIEKMNNNIRGAGRREWGEALVVLFIFWVSVGAGLHMPGQNYVADSRFSVPWRPQK